MSWVVHSKDIFILISRWSHHCIPQRWNMWMIFPRRKFNALLLCLNLCACECCSVSVTFLSLFWQIWGCLPEGKIEESWWEKSGRVHANFVLWTSYFVEVNTRYFFTIPFGNHINHSLFCSYSFCLLSTTPYILLIIFVNNIFPCFTNYLVC